MKHDYLIVFDGVCNLCNATVNFIIRRDNKKRFIFSPLQSPYAQAVLEKYQMTHIANDSFVLIKRERVYLRSSAALEIAKEFNGAWRLLLLFRVVPSGLRDAIYNLIARNRYKLFGKRETCMLPSKDVLDRFCED